MRCAVLVTRLGLVVELLVTWFHPPAGQVNSLILEVKKMSTAEHLPVGVMRAVQIKTDVKNGTFDISSRSSWQTTMMVDRGEYFQLNAVGLWTANPATGMVSADGNHNYPTTGRPNYAYNGPGGFEGQLIARIGTGAPFVAGSLYGRHLGPDEDGGLLSFVINDDIYSQSGPGLADNQGNLRVTIFTSHDHDHARRK
jgi:hypothetical protein